MVSIVKKKKNGIVYHYMKYHTSKIEKTKYLGTSIPKDIESLKRDFEIKIMRLQWRPVLEKIKAGYVKIPRKQRKDDLVEFSFYFTHDTQKIEGSTLTQKETINFLRYKLTPNQKPESDMIETQIHHAVFTKMSQNPPRLTEKTVLKWHKTMFEKTKPEIAARLRTHKIFITNSPSQFPHQKFVAAFMRDFFKWYKSKSAKAINPVELAGMVHFRFVNIHPFGDGNGRISRLLMNYVLVVNDYPPLNIRFAERIQYYKALERSNLQSDELYFVKWFVKYYTRNNKKYS